MSLFEYEEGDYKYILKRHEIQRKRIICQEAKITTLKCLLFDQMSLFWEFHRVLGILPFSRNSERELVSFKWFSVPVLYSVIFITFVEIGAYLSVTRRVANISSEPGSSFQASTYGILNVSLLMPVFFIPLTCWPETKKFIEYLNEWILLEKNYKKVTNAKLNLTIKKWSNSAVTLVACYALLTASGFAKFERQITLGEPIAYVQFLMTTFLMPLYFAFTTIIIKSLCSNVQSQLSKDLKYKNAALKLQQHRLFWLQLRKVAMNVWGFQFRRIALAGCSGIFAICLAIYNGLENLVLTDDPRLGIRSILMLGTSGLVLTLAYASAKRAQSLKTLVEKNFIHNFYKYRKNLSYYDEDTIAEIKLFNKMLKISNVKISGNGYFEISQSSLISLLSLMATNLLILLQFEIYSRTNDNTN